MNSETKVGLFLIAATAVILGSIVFLGKVRLFQRSAHYFVDFKNVEALPTKAAVKIAGVEIGVVREVELVEGRARIHISVDPDIALYKNASARIGSTGIIGSKFVELLPGAPPHPRLENNATIRGLEGVSLESMVAKISTFFEEDEHGDAIGNLKETIANIRNVSRSLNQAIGDHAMEMEQIVMNVRDLTQSIKVVAQNVQEITGEKKEDIKVTLEKLRGVSEKLDAILARVQKGDGMLGTLVADDKAGKDLKEAITSIKDTAAGAKKVIGRFTSVNVFWNGRYRYDTRNEESKVDLGLTFVPRPGKFYAIGATNVGEPVSNEKNVAYERKNRFVAVMGQDFGPLTGYAGAIGSRGGVGLNFRPLFRFPKWDRRFELNAEASDFSRDRTVNGEKFNKALVAAGGHFAVTRWMWLGARVEDILERAAFTVYTNIVFHDEDIAYLFGFASFAR